MPILRILLLPFAFLYKLITDFRNHLFDIGNRKSIEFDRFIINVGNLAVGGTGKTPFVELLIRELNGSLNIAVLSRGYKRKTRGFRLANSKDNAMTLGDEPFQYFTKFGSEVKVAVGEDRALAIPEIIFRDEATQLVILDDAYQHRSVKPQLNILLSDYNRPFYNDYVMPAGRLRESRKHANRADAIVITKCPENIDTPEIEKIERHVQAYSKTGTPIFYTGIKHLEPKRLFGSEDFSENVYLFSGIANATPLVNYVDTNFNLLGHKKYPDHYSFSIGDLKEIMSSFAKVKTKNKCLLTTEKDMVRLLSMKEEAGFLMEYPIFYLPIELYFLRNGDFFADYLKEEISQGMKNFEFK